MNELLPQLAPTTEETSGQLVTIFIDLTEYEYSGHWKWELNCKAVFCSDVMGPFPPDFEGTRGLIHPNDKALVLERIAAATSERIPFLQFRIITTYGEIKTLTGRDLQGAETTTFTTTHRAGEMQHRTAQKSEWNKKAADLSERIHKTGSWWLHLASNEMYYSDGVFRIYDLPAQSFNAHVHTFFPFIYTDDRDLVVDAFTSAFHRQAPLHLEFRILTAKGKHKTIRQVTHWEFDADGALLLFGIVEDITEWQALEKQEKTTFYDLQFTQRLLSHNEQSYGVGYWYINLVTRKVVYSDAIFRLYGLKPQSIPGGISIFLNYVHHDDRDVVNEVTRKILHEHVPPDIEFRLVRPDGTVRYVRQKGKVGLYGEGEMVMMVTMQDITVEKTGERKLADLHHKISAAEFAQRNAEEMAGIGGWFMDVQSEAITWSDGMYSLLGIKTKATPLSLKTLLRYVYTEDEKRFRDEWNLVLRDGQESNFEFRIIRNGQLLHACASFKLFSYGSKVLFIGTIQDVSKQHELKSKLSHLTLMNNAITDNMPDRAILTDDENTIRIWNRRAEDVYGIKKEQALNKNFFDIFPQLKTGDILQLFQTALRGETVWLHHSRSHLLDEYHDLLMIPIKAESGTVTGVLHLLRDVTKEHQMEQQLNERVRFIESLVEASVNRLIVMDRHMNYLYCNHKAAEFYGLDKDQIIGKNVLEVFPGSVNDPTFEHFRRALKGETVRIPAIEGFLDEHYYEVYLVPIKDDKDFVTAVLWTHYNRGDEGMLPGETGT